MLSDDELSTMSEQERDPLLHPITHASRDVSPVKGRAQRERFGAVDNVWGVSAITLAHKGRPR